jgi:hypothetical protein
MAIDFLKIKAEYIKDRNATHKSLAEKYGINASYLSFIASKNHWREERDRIQEKAEEKLSEKLPETIADVKIRHARIGRNLQNTALRALIGDEQKGIKPVLPTGYGESVNAIVKGVTIERQALGMNDKEIQDEVIQKFQAFTFIFHLGDDELQRFIGSINSGGSIEAESVSPAIPADTQNATANR